MTSYLKVSLSEGHLYESFNEPGEGRVKITTPGGKSYYHKIYKNGIQGTFLGVEILDGEYGRELKIKVKGEDQYYQIALKMDSQNGLSDMFKSFIQLMPNLDKNTEYDIATNTTKKNSKGKLYQTIYFTDITANSPIMWAFSSKDCPPAKQIKKAGKESWDFTDVDNCYYEKFEENYERLKDEYKGNRQQTREQEELTQKGATVKPKATTKVGKGRQVVERHDNEENDDELPF